MFFGDIFIFVWLIFIITVTIVVMVLNKVSSNPKNKKRFTISSDGHVVKKSQDLTCETTEGHIHPKNPGFEEERRYIVHEDPEMGYVILNGKKRKISDCKNL